MTDGARWREERRAAWAAQAAALERQRAAEIAQARQLLDDFVAAMTRQGVAPHPLRARAGSATYRTGLTGWYVRRNHALAVGVNGEFYVLDVPPRFGGRLRGVTVEPSDPPLYVGRGARDGESMPLADLLQQRLAAGADFP